LFSFEVDKSFYPSIDDEPYCDKAGQISQSQDKRQNEKG
jgi:hypothetical protein